MSTTKNLETIWTESDPAKRAEWMDAVQDIIEKTPSKEFYLFDNNPDAVTENPVLQFYDKALDRLTADIPSTQVEPGTAVIWYLYNLGFVIKTPTACFGVDLHHRHAVRLEPLLDFITVTHNHDDHYNMLLLRHMNASGKLVVSNFYPAPGYTKATEFTREINGVTIHCYEADHNSILRNFTMPMEFICPTSDRNFVFYTSGDCCSHEFLRKKSDRIDLYAVHPLCGMIAKDAALTLEPEMTFIGHLQELGHEVDRFRWRFSDGQHELDEFQKIQRNACVPLWGEKFLWDGSTITRCGE